MFDGTADPGGSLILAEGIAGVVPTGRNTDLHPINANKYRKISFRMKADVGPAGVPGGFFWYSCDHIIPECENGFPFTVHNGWNNYSFDIPSQGARFHPGGPAWGGTLKGLRFVPSGNSQTHIQLDYVRLTPSSGSDAPPAAPVPLPVVDSPSLAGGFDYATLVRRDAWDMSQPSDISGPENMVYGFGNGLLNGLSVAPNYGDPHFSLPLAGPIDANRFHRLTFNVFYEGPPGAGSEPGGGMVARLIWQTAGAPGVWQNSDDIAVYPGWNDISLDLATYPAYAITEPGTPGRIGWAGQQITSLRFDPDEDSGARRFLVDNIKVAEDATGYSGQYDVKFHDAAWQPGTTADIYSTPSRGGFGGTRIAAWPPGDPGSQHVPLGAESAPRGHPVAVRRAPPRRRVGLPLRRWTAAHDRLAIAHLRRQPVGLVRRLEREPVRRASARLGARSRHSEPGARRLLDRRSDLHRLADREQRPTGRATRVSRVSVRPTGSTRPSRCRRARTLSARTRSTPARAATSSSVVARSPSTRTPSARSTPSRRT